MKRKDKSVLRFRKRDTNDSSQLRVDIYDHSSDRKIPHSEKYIRYLINTLKKQNPFVDCLKSLDISTLTQFDKEKIEKGTEYFTLCEEEIHSHSGR